MARAAALAAKAEVSVDSETRLWQLVQQLGRQEETIDARQLLEQLALRPPQVFVRHEEGNAMVPQSDVGAAARFALREWDRRNAGRAALRHARSGDQQLLDNYFAGGATTRAGIIDAVRAMPAKYLPVFSHEVEARLGDDDGALAAEFAHALADSNLYVKVLAQSRSDVAISALNRLTKTLDAPAALAVLKTALQRPEIASAAAFAIGRLRPQLAAADELMWRLLADRTLGATAAAILAREANRHTLARLEAIAGQTDNWWLQQRARLALQLAGNSRDKR
ncbi:MAG: hypothetical protein KJO54_08170 [Gammaproteobacteria bacterium]|nr:hypothetical protein [Gammaproteobacteria bacterium]NNF60282.1 hypothetical protein [Gammaproteobacteria bacterium]NNM20390.1 hypothetical protein [Gammaproteobacteria bacterium]